MARTLQRRTSPTLVSIGVAASSLSWDTNAFAASRHRLDRATVLVIVQDNGLRGYSRARRVHQPPVQRVSILVVSETCFGLSC